MNYKVVYFTTARGDSPVAAFVDRLDPLTQAKFFAYAELLAEHGPNLKRPYADPVRGKIRELRPRQARVLYFFAVERKIILVHGVIKKTQQLDSADIDLAEGRMMDWLSRQTGGGK